MIIASLFGCADEGTDADAPAVGDDDSSQVPLMTDEGAYPLLARVDLPGRSVRFLEPQPGELVEIETGLIGAASQDEYEASLNGTQLYEHLAQVPAPAQLAEAESRAAVVPAAITKGAGTSEGGNTTRSSFQSQFCVARDRYVPYIGLRTTSDFHTEDAVYMRTSAFAIDGSIRFVALFGGTGTDTYAFNMKAGTYASVKFSTTFHRYAQSIVSPTNGAGYDHCINWHK